MARRIQRLGVLDQPLEPRELVVEFGSWLRVAIRQIETGDDDAVDRRFEIAALRIRDVAGQAAADFDRFCIPREDRHAVPCALPGPERTVSGRRERRDGKRCVCRLQFLQADDVRRFTFEPLQKARQARADAIDVVRGKLERLHACRVRKIYARHVNYAISDGQATFRSIGVESIGSIRFESIKSGSKACRVEFLGAARRQIRFRRPFRS